MKPPTAGFFPFDGSKVPKTFRVPMQLYPGGPLLYRDPTNEEIADGKRRTAEMAKETGKSDLELFGEKR